MSRIILGRISTFYFLLETVHMIDYYQVQKQEQRKRRKLKTLAVVYFVLLVIVAGGVIYFLHSPLSQIKGVSVTVDSQDNALEESILKIFNKNIGEKNFVEKLLFNDKNIFSVLLKRKNISQTLSEELSLIKETSIRVDLFARTVDISATVRQKFGLWCYKNNFSSDTSASSTDNSIQASCFWFDRDGVAFVEGPDTEGQLIYKVVDIYNSPVQLGQKLLDQNSIDNITAMFNFLENSGLGYKTIYLSEPKLEEAHTDLSIAPVIYFSLRNNPTYALKAFLESKLKLLKAGYIDLRISNRIYYK